MFTSGEQKRNKAWKYIYHHWRSAYSNKILTQGGTNIQIDELFSEIYNKFENRILNTSLPTIENLKSYFAKCMYFAWLKYKKSEKNYILDVEDYDFEDIPQFLHLDEYQIEINDILDKLLSALSERCKSILIMFSNNFSMKEIAEKLKLKDDDKAKKEKYECMKKLKASVANNPILENHIKTVLYG